MTEVIKPELRDAGHSVAAAPPVAAEENCQPRVLRIHAGQVHVEVEWPAVSEPVQALPALEEKKERVVRESTVPAGLFDLCAPTVGTFYVAPEPGARPFVNEGDMVRKGQQVGIVEAMKLMIPIEAERDGQVVAVLAPNGSAVEYGERLFTFVTAGAG